MNPKSWWLSLPEEHVDPPESLKAAAIGMEGGLDHPLDDFGTACVADVDDGNVLEFRAQYAQEKAGVKNRMHKTASQVAQPQRVTRSTSEIHLGPSVVPPGHRRLGTHGEQ